MIRAVFFAAILLSLSAPAFAQTVGSSSLNGPLTEQQVIDLMPKPATTLPPTQ